MNFNKIHDFRKQFIANNKSKDHVVIEGNSNVLISAPHGVSQVRLGKYKLAEIGALAAALYLHKESNSYFIAKTQNNNDDANFDDKSLYKSSIEKLIKNKKVKYIIDIHGLSPKRDCDINLGTHLRNNIKTNEKIFNNLYEALVENGFVTKIDQPFMAGKQTICGSFANKLPKIWTLQIEINCAITNKKENVEKFKRLLTILKSWINSIQ